MSIYRLANGLTLILLLVCVLLGVVIYTEIRNMGVYDNMAAGNGDNDGDMNPESGILSNISQSSVAVSQFSEILTRPLFVQGRMPDEEESAENISAPVLSPLRLSLEGVVLSPESRIAVVKDLSSNEIVRLGVGTSHNGWRVKSIEPQTVQFERNGEEQSISIERTSASTDERASKPGFKLPINRPRNQPPRR